MAPKKSVAWNYFIDTGQYKAECTLCRVKISYRSGVSNLTKHLIRKHPRVSLVTRYELVKPTPEGSTIGQEPSQLRPASAVEQVEQARLGKVVQSKIPSGTMNEQEYLYKKNQFMTEFILLYKSMPCLWLIKSKKYHDRDLRSKSYKLLIEKLREFDPTADRVSVVKKINSLRSNLRKEKRKVTEFAKQGVVYKPKLWYYELFDFLESHESGSVGGNESEEENTETHKLKDEEDEVEYEVVYEDELGDPLTSCDEESSDVASPSPSSRKKKLLSTEYAQSSLSKTTSRQRVNKTVKIEPSASSSHHYNNDDQYDLFGKNVAAKLRNIASKNNKQRLMAEKIINDALFLAEMEKITLAQCTILHGG